MISWSNVFGHARSTVKGFLVALSAATAAGVVGAAQQFGQTGQTADWKPYAAAAVAAAVPALVGAFSTDDSKPSTLSAPAQRTATAIEQAGQDYAAKKADEVIERLQEQLNAPA